MKLGIISPEFPPAIGGVETYAVNYVKALSHARPSWQIRVYTRPHPEGEISLPGVEVVAGLHRHYRKDRQLVRSADVDAWHVMNAAYGWVAAEARPVVVTIHGNDFLRPYLPLLKPRISERLPDSRLKRWLARHEQDLGRRRLLELLQKTLPSASCILANSRYTEDVFLGRFPQCRGRTQAALVGVGETFLDAQPKTRTANGLLQLITVSRLSEPRKNVDLVIRALARLKDDYAFVYRVIGDGEDRARLEALTRELGLQDQVRFLGRAPQDQMIDALASSDLFVLVSSVLEHSHEGFGIAYLEANACGTPVLAARLGGAVEAVAEGISGMFVEEAEVEQIFSALRRLLNGEICFSPASCRQHAERFTWDRVVERALPCYEMHTTR